MFTRQDYLDKKCSHREYYGQMVRHITKDMIGNHIGLLELLKCSSEFFNEIPLKRWDNLAPLLWVNFKKYGDVDTLCGRVCILKEAARQIVEDYIRQEKNIDSAMNDINKTCVEA